MGSRLGFTIKDSNKYQIKDRLQKIYEQRGDLSLIKINDRTYY